MSDDAISRVDYEDTEDLLDTWQSNFERMMDGRWPDDDDVTLEWRTTDDEAVLELEEPPENAVIVEKGGGRRVRSIWLYFDLAINAAQDSERFISMQENPMGSDDRKHSALLTVPLEDNRWRHFDDMEAPA
jgi:hypothetical protein